MIWLMNQFYLKWKLIKIWKRMDYKTLIKKTLLIDEGKLLKPHYKKQWSKNNHTRGYCYLISEVFYHFFPEFKNYFPHVIRVNNETHWYLVNRDTGEIVDLTSEQYSKELDYGKGTKCPFFKGGIETERGWISNKGMKLYDIMNTIKNG